MTRHNMITLMTMLVIGVTTRVWFSSETNLTFEDSLISFRYSENISEGFGFVYNRGERVLGTTSPLWTLLLALIRSAGFSDTVANARFLSLIFDTLTVIVLMTTFCSLKHPRFAALWAIIFVTSSGIVPITMSGMETSLLLLSMALTIRGLALKTPLLAIGIAMTVLTRVDGLLFSILFLAAALWKERKWALGQAAMAGTLLLPWLVFSTLYFGDPIPQSLQAKTAVYDLGISSSANPFLARFTPFSEAAIGKTLVRIISTLLILAGIASVRRKIYPLLPITVYFFIYSILFMTSGGLIFPWYLTPATFAYDLILAAGLAFFFGKVESRTGKRVVDIATGFAFIAVITLNISTIASRLDEYRQIQGLEEELRTEIGVWLRENVEPGSRVFLEPIGYIGYHAGPELRIIDEIGIISPQLVRIRQTTTAWYIEALKELRPDYVVEYTRTLEENIAEGTSSPLFASRGELEWFDDNYSIVRTFEATGHYPDIAEKEKRYTVLKLKDRGTG